jgi:hypothetical protein
MSASSVQVPKQLLGYSLQFTECVSSLLDAKAGSVVSIEVFEDVGVRAEDGTIDAIQVKSGGGANPVSDGSVQLWKTFRNWIDQCNTLQLNPINTKFTIYVNAKARGKLCDLMSKAGDPASAKLAEDKIRETFTDKRGGKLKRALGEGVKKQLEIVLHPDNAALLRLIIERFSQRSGSGSAYVDLLSRFQQYPLKTGVIEVTMVYIVGWTKKRLDELIEQSKPAKIDRNEFWQELTTYSEKAVQQPFLARLTSAYKPTTEEIDAELSRRYVRQLTLIDSDQNELIDAVTDYLSAKASAIEYFSRGILNESSLGDFESELKQHWKLNKLVVESEQESTNQIRVGRILLGRCLMTRILLQGAQVPSYFTPGCYHELADQCSVGWHPDYLTLLESA